MRTTNGTIERDLKVRSQIRYQKKRQIKLTQNHAKGEHKQKVLKCSACNPEPLILVLASGEKRRIR